MHCTNFSNVILPLNLFHSNSHYYFLCICTFLCNKILKKGIPPSSDTPQTLSALTFYFRHFFIQMLLHSLIQLFLCLNSLLLSPLTRLTNKLYPKEVCILIPYRNSNIYFKYIPVINKTIFNIRETFNNLHTPHFSFKYYFRLHKNTATVGNPLCQTHPPSPLDTI